MLVLNDKSYMMKKYSGYILNAKSNMLVTDESKVQFNVLGNDLAYYYEEVDSTQVNLIVFKEIKVENRVCLIQFNAILVDGRLFIHSLHLFKSSLKSSEEKKLSDFIELNVSDAISPQSIYGFFAEIQVCQGSLDFYRKRIFKPFIKKFF